MSARFVGLVVASLSAFLAAPSQAELIWDGDASRGTGIFKLIGSNCGSPGSVTAVNDATHGRIWRYNKPSDSNRCESHGIRVGGNPYVFQNGSTYYLGWWSRLSNTVNNNAFFQWKVFPAPGPAGLNWPVVLKMVNGRATMLNRKATDEVYTPWSAPISANTWNHFVVGLRLSDQRDGGWIELWFNGVKQTFSNGLQRWPARLYDTEHVCPKWGLYGASGSNVLSDVDGLKIGTTPQDVLDGGGGSATKLAVSAVSASSDDGNVPANAIDGSLGTRWSANGVGQWIRFDLGARRSVEFVKIAWYKGDTRVASFDLEVSDSPDGPWTTVLGGGRSNGTSTALQTHDVTDASGRYVRILGNGNSVNDWNSITEAEVWGRN
jgi:hypothetical protein